MDFKETLTFCLLNLREWRGQSCPTIPPPLMSSIIQIDLLEVVAKVQAERRTIIDIYKVHYVHDIEVGSVYRDPRANG